MSNVKLTFDAPAHHVLELDGETYHGGDEISVSAERAAEVIARREFPVSYDLDGITRDALEKIAVARGLDTSTLTTKAEIADALQAAPAQPDHLPADGPEPIYAAEEAAAASARAAEIPDHTESDEED